MEKPITFMSCDLRLAGILGLPDVPAIRKRGVILIHGWTGYRIGPHRILVHMARRLNAEGFHTLRFDLRGRGDSEGDGSTTDLDGMITDTRAAGDFFRRETQTNDITLMGICSGSNVAIGAATLEPGIKELALWSVLPFQPEQQARQRIRRIRYYFGLYFRKLFAAETWQRLLRGEIHLRGVGRTIAGEKAAISGGRNLKDSSRDILSAFASFRGRAFFLTGSQDPEGMEGRELFQKFAGAKSLDAQFHLVEGATHSFYSANHEREVIEVTLKWLLERLRSSP